MRADVYEQIEDLPYGASLGVERGYNRVLHRWEVEKTIHVTTVDAFARTEPHLLSGIRHANIIEVYNAELVAGTDDIVTFTMPAIDGGSLDELLERGERLSVGETIAIGVQIASALAYTHTEAGFLHRDVKPGNVLVTADRSIGYLTDFGSAATIDGAGRTGAYGYTLYYADGAAVTAGHLTVTADVFGLGVTLLEACSGPRPIEDFDPADVHRRVHAEGRRPLPDRCYDNFEPHVPGALRRVLRKAMRRDPADRYETARELARELSRLRVVDWKRTDGDPDIDGLVGAWDGKWQSNRDADRVRDVQVCTHLLNQGPNAGQLRVESYWWSDTTDSWRRVIGDSTIDPDDADALANVFDTVDDAIANNVAAS